MGRVIADHLFGPHSAFADFIYPAVLFSLGIAVHGGCPASRYEPPVGRGGRRAPVTRRAARRTRRVPKSAR